jgi:hypothetical protein
MQIALLIDFDDATSTVKKFWCTYYNRPNQGICWSAGTGVTLPPALAFQNFIEYIINVYTTIVDEDYNDENTLVMG